MDVEDDEVLHAAHVAVVWVGFGLIYTDLGVVPSAERAVGIFEVEQWLSAIVAARSGLTGSRSAPHFGSNTSSPGAGLQP